jgi:threonine/homoserine/homoserine lactone efflux protein
MSSMLFTPELAALFAAFFLLALAPNLSVLIVTTRAATSGFRQGALATLGIMAATLLHILVSIFALMIVAEMRPEARQVLRMVAAVYLLGRGIGMIRAAGSAPMASLPVTHRGAASFAMGFVLTLLGLKALPLYLGLLPAFVDIGSLNASATRILLVVVALAIAAAKLGYAAASAGGRIVPSVRVGKALNVVAGAVVMAVGATLIITGFKGP